MHKRTKLWSSLSLAALMGSGTLGAYAQDVAGESATNAAGNSAANPATSPAAQPAGGEGEGLAPEVDPATDDVAYLSQLGLMRGHLLVGVELYRAGHIEHARTHMKHPKSELYAAMVPAFEARGAAGFSDQLTALATAVESDGSTPDEVEGAYSDVLDGIAEAESQASPDPVQQLLVVASLVRTAAVEYGIGVVDGEVVNGHEYQDAFGFTQTAQARVRGIDPGDDGDLAAALEKADDHIQGLFDAGAWPDVMPPETLDVEASLLFGAAARIEILALGLR